MCFVESGGLGMVLAELETLARLQLDVTVVVFNDATLTLKQIEGQGGTGAVGYRTVDFAGIAKAMNVRRRGGGRPGTGGGARSAGCRPSAHRRAGRPSAYTHVIRTIRG